MLYHITKYKAGRLRILWFKAY